MISRGRASCISPAIWQGVEELDDGFLNSRLDLPPKLHRARRRRTLLGTEGGFSALLDIRYSLIFLSFFDLDRSIYAEPALHRGVEETPP